MTTRRTATGQFLGKCSSCRETFRADSTRARHACGGWMTSGTAIKARTTEHECGPKCTSALGPVCDCTCGGTNHGADHH